MPELWESSDLMDVTYAQIERPDNFWMRFFPRVFTSEAQDIYFDQLPILDRRLAPFVAPNVQGRVMRSRGHKMSSFRPAYVKPKHVVDPSRAIARRPGEPLAGRGGIGGNPLTLDQRFDAIVADNVITERELIERRWDWMACQAIKDGRVTVVGQDYPSVTVDFGRDASLTVLLTGGATWTTANTSHPLVDLQSVRRAAFTLGRAPIRTLIFGQDAWSAFAAHADTQKLLDEMRRGSNSNFNTTGLSDGAPFEYQGQISGGNDGGRFDLWVYSNDYEETDELTGALTVVPFINTGDVIGVGGAIQGVMAFGAIMDKRAGLKALPIFTKMYEEDDPSVVYTLSQSAPLPVPVNPNNSFRIRVL